MYHKISDCIGILYRLICFLLGTQLMNWFKLMICVWTHTRISQHHSLWDLVLCCGLLIRWWKYATCVLVSVLECFKCPRRLIKSDDIYFEVSIHVFQITRILPEWYQLSMDIIRDISESIYDQHGRSCQSWNLYTQMSDTSPVLATVAKTLHVCSAPAPGVESWLHAWTMSVLHRHFIFLLFGQPS